MSLDQPTQSPSTDVASRNSSSPPLTSPPAKTTSMTTPNSPTDSASMAMTTSAPELGEVKQIYGSPLGQSPSFDTALLQSSRGGSADPSLSTTLGGSEGMGLGSPTDTDPQIIEALRSKDRLWVLKLGEMMESLIIERKLPRIELVPTTSYQRMLVHRCSTYYKLVPEPDPTTKTIFVSHRAESRIPARKISELVPAEESAQPAFKIMRRANPDRRGRSQPDSVTGDDGDVSDVEASEAGSVGGRSNAAGGSKRHLTIEEREAAYNEARSRIFMGFGEKEKEKDAEKGSSANSSSISLVSGSGSTGGGPSSAGDVDDSVSSAATESEWSGPATRDRRDRRRVGSGGPPPRSARPGTAFNTASGSGSSRHSRAASPSSMYPSLYDPSGSVYDPSFGAQGPPHGYIQYYSPYPQAHTGPPVMPAYPYPYSPYGYPSHQQHHSDPTSPNEHPYLQSQPPQHLGYPPNAYAWAPPPPSQSAPPATSPHAVNPHLPGMQQPATHPSTPHGAMPYQGYFPEQYPPYPMPGYYGQSPYGPPPGAPPQQHPQQPPHLSGYYPNAAHSDPRLAGSVPDQFDPNRTAMHHANGQGTSNGNGRKHQTPRRQQWNYGPGVAIPGTSYGPQGGSDAVGPRLSNRRTSSGSQSAGNRTPGDETSSVTHHPLPARPDWAVGLKAQPTLSSGRHHDHSNPNSQRNPHMPPQPPPQPTDFPPLSSAPEKKTPVIGGAWTNPSSIKSVLKPGPSGSTAGPPTNNALVHYPNSNIPIRLEDQERGFERPPPKSSAELYNPKGVRKPPNGNNNDSPPSESSPVGGRSTVDIDALSARIGGLRVGQAEGAEDAFVSSPSLTAAAASSEP
ncbi:hypothetical protein BDW22DRAFT_1356898 [Trametopsis cervina]|nr:hypothetical protein BDW22DRAFT_1356898 [Trametopsis cervina]